MRGRGGLKEGKNDIFTPLALFKNVDRGLSVEIAFPGVKGNSLIPLGKQFYFYFVFPSNGKRKNLFFCHRKKFGNI